MVINYVSSDLLNVFNNFSSIFTVNFYTRWSNVFELIQIFLPEFILFCGIFLYFLTYFIKGLRVVKVNFFLFFLILFGTFGSFYFTVYSYNYEFVLVSFYYIWLSKLFIILCVFFFSLMHYYQIWFAWYKNGQIHLDLGTKYFELNLIILISTLSSFILLSSNDIIFFLVALEVFSLCAYVITSLTYEKIAIEATLKYFFSNILFSLLIILGLVFIYWSFFETNLIFILQILYEFQQNLQLTSPRIALFGSTYYVFDYSILDIVVTKKLKYLVIGLAFIILGLLAKLGLFPGHFWVLDVYGNISVLSNIFLSIIPKFIYVLLILKWHLTFSFLFDLTFLSDIYVISSVLSIIYGSYITIGQWRIKKFMAGSSIVNVAFIVLILAFPGSLDNTLDLAISYQLHVKLIFYFLFIYLVNVFFFFFFYGVMIQPSRIRVTNYFEDLREFVQVKINHKFVSFLLVLVLLSFAGVPPLMGFFPKLLLFNFLIINKSYFFIILIMVFSSINVFYYIRVIRFIMFSNVRVFGLFQVPYNTLFKFFLFFILFVLLGFFFLTNIFFISICP